MGIPNMKMDIDVRVTVQEKTLNQCMQIIEMWLANNPDKTIIVAQENGDRVLLIGDKEATDGKEQGE